MSLDYTNLVWLSDLNPILPDVFEKKIFHKNKKFQPIRGL